MTDQTPRSALAHVTRGPMRMENVTRALHLMAGAAPGIAQLFVLPEVSVDSFSPQHRSAKHFSVRGTPVLGPLGDRFQEYTAARAPATVIKLYERAGPGTCFLCSPVYEGDSPYRGKQPEIHVVMGLELVEQAGRHAPFLRVRGPVTYDPLLHSSARSHTRPRPGQPRSEPPAGIKR